MTARSEIFSGFQKSGKEPGMNHELIPKYQVRPFGHVGTPWIILRMVFVFYSVGYKYSSKKWLCFIFTKDHSLKFSGKTLRGRISGWICMIIFTHSIFLSLNLYLTSLSFQIRRMVTTRLGSQNYHWIGCGIPTISSYDLLQVYLVWWLLVCGGHNIAALET